MTKAPSPGDRRRPAAFAVDAPEERHAQTAAAARVPKSFDEGITLVPDAEDPFLSEQALQAEETPVAVPRRRRFSFVKLAAGAFGILLSLAIGLWTDALIRDLFTRADWLGYGALTVLAVGLLALAIAVGREVRAIMRLGAAQALKTASAEALALNKTAEARSVVTRLDHLLAARPETAKGRARLAESRDDIIDPPELLALAERELLAPLDRKARALILNAAKRVSVVTAVSPRAIVDLAYVLFEVVRLVRAMAELYGGHPGTFGMMRLLRDVVAHLAVTGSIAVGDGLVQQILGHGLASRLSARLGEGVVNGLMTARIGIAAMDLCRPLAFSALKRPGIGDFISDLTPSMSGDKKPPASS